MTQIKRGSRWSGGDDKVFVVIGTLPIEQKIWVHYRLEKPVDHMPAEFCCFEESFLVRFRQLPD
jgi:hypothetical protein